MNFTNILLHQHDLYETREDRVTSEMSFWMNCIAYSLRNVLFCVYKFFSLLGRYMKSSKENSDHVCSDLVQERMKMRFSYKITVSSSLIF